MVCQYFKGAVKFGSANAFFAVLLTVIGLIYLEQNNVIPGRECGLDQPRVIFFFKTPRAGLSGKVCFSRVAFLKLAKN